MKYSKFLWLFSLIFIFGIASCSLFDFENDTDTNTENNDCNCINYQVCINNVCECPEGYSGTQCQQIDDCGNVACVNGGSCVNGSCVCSNGYTGVNCEIPIDPCADDICVNGTLYSGCECICDDGWEGEFCSTPAPDIDVFTPDDIENICPYHIGGDREFSGNGPEVTIRCEAVPEWDKIYVDIYFHAKETTPDWTEAEIETRRKIYDAPPGKKIHRIVSPTVSNADYLDTNLYDDFPDIYGGLVRKFRSIGDTGGNDLGPCIDDYDAELNIEFNPMTIELVDK